MLFLQFADLSLVAEALRTQIARQTARLAELRTLRRQWAGVLPTGGRHLMQHMAEQSRLDLKWLRAVLADVESGGVHDSADPARLAGAD
jgi:hypothetical protein